MRIERLTKQPVLSTNTHPQAGGNINGPSLVRVPPWVKNPAGRYYLYFAHHNGRQINLAVANDLTGPWQLLPTGALPLSETGFCGHIASPDVHVDHQRQRLLMYFHGADTETDFETPQYTRLAVSDDGLHFTQCSDNLGSSYWRVFNHQGLFYTLEMPGVFKRSSHPGGPFETGPTLFSDQMRHSAVAVRGNNLEVFYSNVGDNPESIVHTCIDISEDWQHWSTGIQTIVAAPHGSAEGADCRALPSQRGMAVEPVRQLRDPALYEENGDWYLLFSVAGEQGIAIARLDHF